MAKSATDVAVEQFAAAAPKPRPLQTEAIAVYLAPVTVDALSGALNQSADALMSMAGEDRFRGQPRKSMLALERECREAASHLWSMAQISGGQPGWTQTIIDARRDLMERTKAELARLNGMTKTTYVKSRLTTCCRLLDEAQARLQSPALKQPALKQPASKQSASKKPEAKKPKAKASQTTAHTPPKTRQTRGGD